MSYRYFAYGSNLDAEHFGEWTQGHGYFGRALDEGRVAVLDDWELALSVPSRYWMGAVGTIEPKPGGAVYGVLFDLPEEWADMVRHKEGVATGLYRETEVEARLYVPGAEDDGGATLQLMTAAAFRAAEGRTVSPAPPVSKRWLDIVIRGAQARGLPDLWIADLKRRGR